MLDVADDSSYPSVFGSGVNTSRDSVVSFAWDAAMTRRTQRFRVVSLLATILWCAGVCAWGGAPAANRATTSIVCMVPNVTEILFAVGAGDQVVADASRVSDGARVR